VHRDLKPSNILVVPSVPPAFAGAGSGAGEPDPEQAAEVQIKLLDFGIAKLLAAGSAEEAAERTRPGLRLMTPEYASPEQQRGEAVTPAADVYALGVLLYRLLCGHHPYTLTGRAKRGIEQRVLEARPEPPSAVVCRVDEAAAGEPAWTTPAAVAAARSYR
jgi:eukaryotic-like serine/threonine-protein kinase